MGNKLCPPFYLMENSIEEEIKLSVTDIPSMLETIRKIARYVKTEYIRDVIYGTDFIPRFFEKLQFKNLASCG